MLRLSRKELADKIGIKSHRITEMECGRVRVQVETAINLEDIYGIDLRWILTGDGKIRKKEVEKHGNAVFIQTISGKLHEGHSFLLPDEEEVKYKFGKKIISSRLQGKSYLISFTGDSMEPTLYNRDVLIIDTGRTAIYDGELFAIRMDDTIMIKRLFLTPGEKVIVSSDNKKHHSYETDRNNVIVMAQVVWIARTLVGM